MAMAPPTATPTIAPVDRGVPVPVGESVGVSDGVGVLVSSVTEVENDVDDSKVVEDVASTSVLEGVLEGILSVTMTVCLVTVTLELFGMVLVVPESVMILVDDVVLSSLSVAISPPTLLSSSSLGSLTEGRSSGQANRAHGSSEQHPLNLLESQV